MLSCKLAALHHLPLASFELLAVEHPAECQNLHPLPLQLLAEKLLVEWLAVAGIAAVAAAAVAAAAADTERAAVDMNAAAPLKADQSSLHVLCTIRSWTAEHYSRGCLPAADSPYMS